MGVKIREKVKGSDVWWAFVNHDGERCSSMIGSSKAAKKVKEDLEARLKLGLELFPEKKQQPTLPTFGTFYQKFESGYLTAACRESTVDRYEMEYRLRLKPKFGDLPIDGITRDGIKELIAELLEKGLSRNSIRNTIATLRVVLNQAIEEGLVTINTATRLTKFFKQAKMQGKIDFLTAAEVPLFLEAARQRDAKRRKNVPEYYPLFLCAVHTGMRAGELAGSQWGDIDWNGKFIMVRRSVHGARIDPTKTGKIRRIDLSENLIGELESLRRRRLEEAMKAGRGNQIPEWIFVSAEGTPLDMHNVERREFERCLERAKLRRIRLHDLRHTFASLLIQNGESLAYVRDQLGHSSIKTTVDIYGHLVPGANRQAVNRLPVAGESAPQAHPEENSSSVVSR